MSDLDELLFLNGPCSAPCWWNIVPGFTQTQKALETLSSLEFVEHSSITRETSSATGLTHIRWANSANQETGSAGEMILGDNRVLNIQITLDTGATLGDLLDIYGEPDGVLIFPHTIDSPAICYNLRFLWMQEGLAAISIGEARGKLIGDDSIIDALGFYQPTFTVEDYLSQFNVPDSLLDLYQEWEGDDKLIVR